MLRSREYTFNKQLGKFSRFYRGCVMSRKIVNSVAATAIAASALVSFVYSSSVHAAAGQIVKAHDSDNDGTLDLAEVKKAATAKFERVNTDKDGTLDVQEAKAVGIKLKALKAADPDNDGTLDLNEFLSVVEARFKAADPDKDSTVSAAELKTKAGKALAATM